MRFYNVIVIRKQVWSYNNLMAQSKEEARSRAEQMACTETPCDDYLHDTIVQEAEEV